MCWNYPPPATPPVGAWDSDYRNNRTLSEMMCANESHDRLCMHSDHWRSLHRCWKQNTRHQKVGCRYHWCHVSHSKTKKNGALKKGTFGLHSLRLVVIQRCDLNVSHRESVLHRSVYQNQWHWLPSVSGPAQSSSRVRGRSQHRGPHHKPCRGCCQMIICCLPTKSNKTVKIKYCLCVVCMGMDIVIYSKLLNYF